jgi:hypothetical protein
MAIELSTLNGMIILDIPCLRAEMPLRHAGM